MITQSERSRLADDIAAIWPRVENNDASLDEVRALALRVFDRIGGVGGLDRWEKHHFVWVLKGLAWSRQNPGEGLHTALHAVEQTLAPPTERDIPSDKALDALNERDLRAWMAAA